MGRKVFGNRLSAHNMKFLLLREPFFEIIQSNSEFPHIFGKTFILLKDTEPIDVSCQYFSK
jgi:hypothetical protein